MNSKNNLEMNNKIEICNEGKKAYDIVLRDSFADLLDQMEFLEIEKKKVCIVTESNVAPIYLKEVCELISSKASKTITFSFEAGEKHKQLKTIEALYEELIINHFDRQDLLIALGGGVVGDMTGYAAATYLRGIDFVQVPTTLLSQVDSSIGGKTGVDFLQYKNMVGAFHQPKLVYINTTTLKSLPEREYFSGMGEVIKHGLIKDADYYEWIKENIDAIKAREHEAVPVIVTAVARTVFDNNGKLKDGAGLHGGDNFCYIRAARQLASECNVVLLDLFEASKTLFEKVGKENIHYLMSIKQGINKGKWPEDFDKEMLKKETVSEDTHLNKYGAYLITNELVRLIMDCNNRELDALKKNMTGTIQPVEPPEKLQLK